MAQRIKRGGKKKYGITLSHTPQYHSLPTGEATLPLWQPDGLKFVSKDDFKWLIRNGHIEMEMPEEILMPTEMIKDDLKEEDHQS